MGKFNDLSILLEESPRRSIVFVEVRGKIVIIEKLIKGTSVEFKTIGWEWGYKNV